MKNQISISSVYLEKNDGYEIERNPESLIYTDLKIIYTVYTKELELKLSEQ